MPSIGSSIEVEKVKPFAEINAVMAELRGLFVTPLPGQEMLYLEKLAEANRYDTNYPTGMVPMDPGNYPLITAEIGITGADHNEVAQVYITKAAQWKAVAATLEKIRLGAIRRLEDAVDRADIESALSDFHTAVSNFYFVISQNS